MMRDYEVYRDCDIYRLVCTDYTRDSYIEPLCVNDSGARILKCLKRGKSIDETASEVADGEAIEQVKADIEGFIEALEKKGYMVKE
ncbi:MAG: PqqD family protein [Lachnospiraceae bacterium]|nr:PqqD family protein [Lachnospiraceae bacterium]